MKNESEYLKLLTGNYSRLYSYVLCMVCNKDDAEDVMQDTAIVMWEKFESFTPGTNFVAWAKSIAHHKIMDLRKKQVRNRCQLDDNVLELLISERESYKDDSSRKIEALEQCIKKLQVRDRKILKLKYFEGRQVKDIAAGVNVPLHTMYRLIARLHELLLGCVKRNLVKGDTL